MTVTFDKESLGCTHSYNVYPWGMKSPLDGRIEVKQYSWEPFEITVHINISSRILREKDADILGAAIARATGIARDIRLRNEIVIACPIYRYCGMWNEETQDYNKNDIVFSINKNIDRIETWVCTGKGDPGERPSPVNEAWEMWQIHSGINRAEQAEQVNIRG